MAKDKKKNKEGESAGAKIGAFLTAVFMLTTFVLAMLLLIKCDVGGFGTVLRPVFKDIPVVNKILPPPSDEEVAKESDYPYDTLEEALEQVSVLEANIKQKDADIKALGDKKEELEKEIERLSAFETSQKDFEEQKNKFYNEIVYGEMAPDTDTYIEWYNQLDAEYAEQVYRDIITAKQVDDEIKNLAAAYESMDRKKAAKILENMKNDLDTVALIMNNMSSSARGEVLAEMDPELAASVTKKLLP